jgi:hypothetical protein
MVDGLVAYCKRKGGHLEWNYIMVRK